MTEDQGIALLEQLELLNALGVRIHLAVVLAAKLVGWLIGFAVYNLIRSCVARGTGLFWRI